MWQSGSNFELEIFLILAKNDKLINYLEEYFHDDPFVLIKGNKEFDFLESTIPNPILVCIIDSNHIRKEKLETLHAITGVSPITSLIYVSGENTREIIRKVHLSSIYKYFLTPVDYEKMLIAIREAFKSHRAFIHDRIMTRYKIYEKRIRSRRRLIQENKLIILRPGKPIAGYRNMIKPLIPVRI